ncbi:hypothetical protein B0H44_000010 [Clostridium beijerinckii]|nr:hypothetical protein [Clostridium beijerinckii]
MERLVLFFNKLLCKFKLFRKKLYYVGGNDALPPPHYQKMKKKIW